jgi:hypothetical protein
MAGPHAAAGVAMAVSATAATTREDPRRNSWENKGE